MKTFEVIIIIMSTIVGLFLLIFPYLAKKYPPENHEFDYYFSYYGAIIILITSLSLML